MAQKDLNVRVLDVIGAWERMRPHKAFFGLTLEDFKLRAKPYMDARAELLRLEAQAIDAASKRDQGGAAAGADPAGNHPGGGR